MQQVMNMECKNVFFQPPLLDIKFSVGGTPHHLLLKLPVMINKFCEPTTMTSQDFFKRWKQLSGPSQESQRIFSAKLPMDKEAISSKLLGYGISVITGIDPNPDNLVSAGVINTKSMLVGCLLRLEPNIQTQMYRLTVRTSHELVTKVICDVLAEQF